MKFTDEVGKKIIAALRQRLADQKLRPCAICGTTAWLLNKAFVRVIVQEDLVGVNLGGSSFPMIALICTNCGNTHFLNLKVLGLGELTEPDSKPDVAQSE